MGKTYQITSSDLETYADSDLGATEKSPLTNWMSLQSQIYVEGVKELHSALNQNPAPDIEQIKEKTAAKLLQDLERVAKREEATNKDLKYGIPEFKQEFYEELKKPPAQRSEEYNNFIKVCCNELNPSRHMTEMVAAKALQKLDEPNLSFNDFKESVEGNIKEYKEKYADQAAKDHTRTAILYKGPEGKTRRITVEELMNSKEVNLSEEQRGFINTSWQQGSFSNGWFSYSSQYSVNSTNANLAFVNPKNRTDIFIDASTDNVKVHNRSEAIFMDMESSDIIPLLEASVTVDITDLKGDQFSPGVATAKPKISFEITEFNESLPLKVPDTLKTSVSDKSVSEYIKQEAAIGYIYMLDNNVKKEGAWNSIKTLMGEEKASEYVIKNADLNKLSLNDIEILAQNSPANIEPDRKKILTDRISELTIDSGEAKLDPAQHMKALKLFNKFELDDTITRGLAEKASGYVVKNADLSKLSLDDIQILAQNPPAELDADRKKILGDRISELTINSEEANLDPEKYTQAVKLFNKFEPDQNIRRGYAEQKLDDYLSAQTSSTLGDKELNYIKNGIVSIMSPSCSSDTERAALENNAGKIIRQCASEKGAEMSFSQKWQKFKDAVSDVANWLIGKENKAKTIMQENAGIVTKISKHLSNEKLAKTPIPPKEKSKSEGRNF